MRCIQPYISQVEKLGQQIQQSHSLNLNNSFSQRIASKYSGFKLGLFPVITFTWLQKANIASSISNTIQIFKNHVINVLPSTNQLNVNWNFLCCWNTSVEKSREKILTEAETSEGSTHRADGRRYKLLSQQETSHVYSFLTYAFSQSNLTFSETNSTAIANYSQIRWQKLRDTTIQQVESWKEIKPVLFSHPHASFKLSGFFPQSQTLKERVLDRIEQSKQMMFLTSNFLSPSKTLVTSSLKAPQSISLRDRIFQLENNFNSAKQNSEFNQPNTSVPSGFDNRPVSLVTSNNARQVEDLPHKNSDGNGTPDFALKLTKTQTSVLIDSITTNWNVSVLERKFSLPTQGNFALLSIFKGQKTALDFSDDLKLEPVSRRTRRFNQLASTADELIFRHQVNRAVVKTNNQTYQKDALFSPKLAMELVRSPAIITSTSSKQDSQGESKRSWEQSKPTNFDSYSSIDVNGLADRVFQVIERKIKIERQRRGIL